MSNDQLASNFNIITKLKKASHMECLSEYTIDNLEKLIQERAKIAKGVLNCPTEDEQTFKNLEALYTSYDSQIKKLLNLQ